MAYSPASNLTSTGSIAHLASVWYNRKALDQLKKVFRFLGATEPDQIPLRVGKTVQWFRYTLFAANTTPSAEGTVGSGVPLASSTISATVSEYSDFVTISSLLEETAIDPITQNAAEQLGYRAGISVDTITRAEFDSNSTPLLSTLGAFASVADIRRSVALMRGADVRPLREDHFLGIIHPYVLYDIKSDNTAGGFIDVLKYSKPEEILNNPGMLHNGEAGKVENTRLVTTTNVATSGTAPNVLYRMYIVGKGAVGSVDLAGTGPSRVEDPEKQSFKINVIRGGPQIADPEGKIGSAVSYRFVYVAKTLDSSTYRYKMVDCDASLV